jgi:hypothetical protein
MLICFIAPQDVCLSCLVTRLAASDRVEDTYCDCCGVVGAMDETGDDYGSPIQIPYDDSNCPSCIMKSMGIILNPAVEFRRTELRSSSFRLQTCGIRKQPAFRLASGLSSAHLSGASLYQRFMV